jgi:hypothetical protein
MQEVHCHRYWHCSPLAWPEYQMTGQCESTSYFNISKGIEENLSSDGEGESESERGILYVDIQL